MGMSRKTNCGLMALVVTFCAAVGLLVGSAGQAHAAAYVWNTTSGGNWDDANWTTVGYPNAAADTATISQNITADQILHINIANATVGALTFGDSTTSGGYNNWTIDDNGAGNLLTLNNAASPATITSNNGNNVISAGLVLSTTGANTFNVNGGTLYLSGGTAASGAGFTANMGNGGVLILGGTALHTGDVTAANGELRIASATALGSGNLNLNSSVFQSSDAILGAGGFTRSYGTGAGQYQHSSWSGTGFSAYGGNLTVNIGGSGTPAQFSWGETIGVNTLPTLPNATNSSRITLGSATANGTVLWLNPILLTTAATGSQTRYLTALTGVGSVAEADIQGNISDTGGAAGSMVIGTNSTGTTAMYGTVIFSGNNSYTGSTTVNFGTLRIASANALTSGVLTLGGIPGSNISGSRGVLEGSNAANSFGANGFTRSIGTGSNQVQFDAYIGGAGGGFSAYGTTNTATDNLTVNLGGSGAQLTWGNTGFNMPALAFGSRLANATVNFVNPLALNGSARTVNVIKGVGTTPEVDFQGVLSGTGSSGLIKTGTGTLKLSAANTYVGGTGINAGILQLGNTLALQNSSLTVGVANSLAFNSGIGTFTLGGLLGSVTTSNFALTDTVGSAITLQIGNNGATTTYTGAMSGAGGLTKIGGGTSTLNGTNTYTGTTAVNGGFLTLNFSAITPTDNIVGTSSALALSGGTLGITGKASTTNNQTFASLTVNAGGSGLTLTPGTSGTVTVNLGGASWGRNGNGTLNVNVAAAGTKNVNTGITGAAQTTTTAIIAYVNVNDGAGSNGFGYIDATGKLQRYSQTLTNLPVSGSSSTTSYQIPNTGNITLSADESIRSLTVLGSGTETLNLNGKKLTITSGGLGTFGSATTFNVNGTGQLGDNDAELIIQGFTSAAAIMTIGSTATISGGTGSLTKAGPNTLVVNSANTYSGATTINGGVLRVGNTMAFQNSPVAVWPSNSLTFAAALGSAKFGGLNGTGNVALSDIAGSPAAVNLEIAGVSTGVYSYGGVLSGLGGLTKSTNGKQTLTGANTYAGTTSVTGGTLVADNNTALSTTAASVTGGTLEIATGRTVTNSLTLNGSGATLRVNGTIQTGTLTLTAGTVGGAGTIVQAVTAGSGVNVAPGSSGIGTLTTGALTLGAASKFQVEVNSNTSTGDKLVSTGNVTIDSTSTLELAVSGSVMGDYSASFVILQLGNGFTRTGNFAGGSLDGDIQTFATPYVSYTLNYAYNAETLAPSGGNDVLLTFSSVPEPSSLGLLLGGSAMLVRRRRRK